MSSTENRTMPTRRIMMGTIANEAIKTQLAAIRTQLIEEGYIDKPIAVELCDCDRRGARIWDLRHRFGMDIVTEKKTKKNRYGHTVNYAVYRLGKDAAVCL